MLPSMIFWYSKFNISADGLGGRGGRPHMAYNLRTNEVLLHGKFQPPSSNGLAVHKLHPEVQTKKGALDWLAEMTKKSNERYFDVFHISIV